VALGIHHLIGLRVESAAMRFTMRLALVMAFVACKKPGDQTAGSGSATPTIPTPAPADAAIATPWQVPAGTKPATGDADATALGTTITVHLVERVTALKAADARNVKTVLVLEGTGAALAADETDEGFAQDGARTTVALAGEADVVLPPLTPPRPFADKDGDLALDFKGPLLFLAHFESKGEKRAVAVAQDKDTIVTWTMIAASDAVDVAPSWSTTGTIKLAPGTKVNAPALVAAAMPAAPAAGGALAATALDDLIASKRINRDHVTRRVDLPHSQWAVVEGKGAAAGAPPESYTVIRVTAAGPSMVELAAPGPDAWFDGVSGLDVKDVDADGTDDAVITATWERQRSAKKLTTTEKVDQVYVVGGAQLAVGAQHASQYKTTTNLGPDENPQPEESIAFTYSIAKSTLHVEMGASSIEKKRVKGLLDPKRDPLLVPGDLPIAFK
jgi:hypothetical protein